MKLFNFRTAEKPDIEIGMFKADHFYSTEGLLDGLHCIDDLLKSWTENYNEIKNVYNTIEETSYEIEENRIEFLPPVLLPNSFRDFYAFEQHVKTARAKRGLDVVPEWYKLPVFYFSNHHVFCGHKAEVKKPAYTNELDFELEIACIIGKKGKNISASEGEQYIAGYSILNDWSARDIQRKEMKVGLGPAKGKDFASSIGPFLVSPEELKNNQKNKGFDLKMTARKNGKTISAGNWSDIHFSFSEMIARASEAVTLYPGDILGSGTVGSGCILELGAENTEGWLQPGDLIELEVEELGILTNRIV